MFSFSNLFFANVLFLYFTTSSLFGNENIDTRLSLGIETRYFNNSPKWVGQSSDNFQTSVEGFFEIFYPLDGNHSVTVNSFLRKDEIDDVFIATKGLAKELKIPFLTPSQVNRMGARDNVIEGDKAAGSYDKMMVADICLSLSRQKEDKVLGTGRVHVMKNRYGQDGMTYNVKMDTNNGHIEFEGKVNPAEIIEDPNRPKFNLSRETLSKLI